MTGSQETVLGLKSLQFLWLQSPADISKMRRDEVLKKSLLRENPIILSGTSAPGARQAGTC